jgi:2,4-dienoyl-CoA reductase-like NADH-dependent reductase (Old Yellow Enzyme family)
MSAMNCCYTGPDHYPSAQTLAWYAARAIGGTGLIFTEAVGTCEADICNTYRKYNNLNLFNEIYVPFLSELVEHVKSFQTGAKIFAQLAVSSGRQGSSELGAPQIVSASPIRWVPYPENSYRNFDYRATLRANGYMGKIPEFNDPEEALSFAQKVPGTHMGGETPREVTIEEIRMMTEALSNGAKLAKRAGFDGVEIHACHGYFHHSFLALRTNKRTDEYGGSFENRTRIFVEQIHAVKKKVGPDYPVGIRFSASDELPEGFDAHFAKRVAKRCEEAGADFIHLSDGSYEKFDGFLPNHDGVVIPKAAIIKEGLHIPLICCQVHDPDKALDAISTGKADMISQGRQQIADPDWANKVKEGRIDEIVRCTRCNHGCSTRFPLGLPVRCLLNPVAGNEQYVDRYAKRPILPIVDRVWKTGNEIGKEPSRPVED